ncbi:hypothetical protein AHF37_12504 [Paragonimus kellicotti]|nr:hypothetical protein AHF37_12504 [Paragonimus kellicotti]
MSVVEVEVAIYHTPLLSFLYPYIHICARDNPYFSDNRLLSKFISLFVCFITTNKGYCTV